MHLFFDTVWKLHIGEIPEKPKYRNFEKVGRITLHDTKKYNEAIAAIKQNALTVGNPEIINKSGLQIELWNSSYRPKEGKFYPWLGGYETKCEHPCMCTIRMQDGLDYNYHCKEFAILTLPEEKKNVKQ